MPSRIADERHIDSLSREQLLKPSPSTGSGGEPDQPDLTPDLPTDRSGQLSASHRFRDRTAHGPGPVQFDGLPGKPGAENRLRVPALTAPCPLPSSWRSPSSGIFWPHRFTCAIPFAVDDVSASRVHPVLQQMCLDFGTPLPAGGPHPSGRRAAGLHGAASRPRPARLEQQRDQPHAIVGHPARRRLPVRPHVPSRWNARCGCRALLLG